MKTKITLFVATLLLITGCHKQENPEPVSETVIPPSIKKEEQVKPAEPVEPEVKPIPRSSEFLKGYWDGYTGTWLGPFAWTLAPDYRHGWAMGKKDRKEGKDPQYPKPN